MKPGPSATCPCERCTRNRVRMRNKYYIKHGQLDKVEELPEVTVGLKCDCNWCTRNRNVRKSRYKSEGRYEIRSQYIPLEVHIDFTPHGPGRYEWDRTTDKDYGWGSNWKNKRDSSQVA